MRAVIAIASVATWAVFGVAIPILGYSKGTSRNVSVHVLAEPFKDSDALVYEWRGDVYRSCPIELRRYIVDANDVVTTMRALSFGALPRAELGVAAYELKVEVPLSIAEGPATYYVSELAKCSWLQRVRPIAYDYPPVHFNVER